MQDHYSTTLTLHSLLSCVAGSMIILAVAPPLTPHLTIYVFVFWAGASLLLYTSLNPYLSDTLNSLYGDIYFIYSLFTI